LIENAHLLPDGCVAIEQNLAILDQVQHGLDLKGKFIGRQGFDRDHLNAARAISTLFSPIF